MQQLEEDTYPHEFIWQSNVVNVLMLLKAQSATLIKKVGVLFDCTTVPVAAVYIADRVSVLADLPDKWHRIIAVEGYC